MLILSNEAPNFENFAEGGSFYCEEGCAVNAEGLDIIKQLNGVLLSYWSDSSSSYMIVELAKGKLAFVWDIYNTDNILYYLAEDSSTESIDVLNSRLDVYEKALEDFNNSTNINYVENTKHVVLGIDRYLEETHAVEMANLPELRLAIEETNNSSIDIDRLDQDKMIYTYASCLSRAITYTENRIQLRINREGRK